MSKVKNLPKTGNKQDTKGTAPKIDETIENAEQVINEVKETVATENAAPEKPKKPVIEIVTASYGLPGNMVDFQSTCKLNQKLTNKMVGKDPAPKKVKSATITISVDGELRTATFTENEKILFEEFQPEVKEEIVAQD